MVKMYLHIKNKVPNYDGSKVINRTGRHADRYKGRETLLKLLLHTRMVIIVLIYKIRNRRTFSFITARIRRMTEGGFFIRVCLLTRGGVPHPVWGVPSSSLPGVPHPA